MSRTATQPRIRTECRGCQGALQQLGELCSLACRWLWGGQQAHAQLDDRREAQEIHEAVTALRILRARQAAAIADGRITLTERSELEQLGAIAERELADIVAYDERENELHREIGHCTEHARGALAPLSRAADRAEAGCSTAAGGLTEPVWGLMVTQMIEA